MLTLLITNTTILIRFILNEKVISTDLPPGTVLLDLIRYHQHLMGTKIGCREGDCGACTVLVGEMRNNELLYKSMTCCLMPIGNAHGKHIVTIEGINPPKGLNPIQQAMVDEGATQCGFCTPGFVLSLAGFCLNAGQATKENSIAAMDGNICRCTGYKSIERAAAKIAELMEEKNGEDTTKFVVRKEILPVYFTEIKNKLQLLLNGELTPDKGVAIQFVGGGTDLYVQKHDEMTNATIHFLFDNSALNGVNQEGNRCIIGASATISDLQVSGIITKAFPAFQRYAKLISSTPIRNMATIAGNFVNASPIGDFTIFFLALDAQLVLSDGKTKRELPLRKLYKGYKTLDKKPGEYIGQVSFELPGKSTLFNFEKVSKRTHLDIASVNSAISITMKGDRIENGAIAAGGVGPIPLYLQKTSEFLKGKNISEDLIFEVIEMAQAEISPISDARGTAEYKRLLLSQLLKAHFITLFPETITENFITIENKR
ncbi:MAG: FAD binding domain-containing protein [Chitinophagaceae bacterium]